MKPYTLIALAAMGLVAGCNQNSEPTATPSSAPNSAMTSSNPTRDEYLASMDKQMAELDAKIDKLEANNTSNPDKAADATTREAYANLRAQRDAVRKQYDEMKSSGQDTWDKTKAAFQSGWDKLEAEYDKAAAKVTGN